MGRDRGFSSRLLTPGDLKLRKKLLGPKGWGVLQLFACISTELFVNEDIDIFWFALPSDVLAEHGETALILEGLQRLLDVLLIECGLCGHKTCGRPEMTLSAIFPIEERILMGG